MCVGVWKWYIFRNTSRNTSSYNWFESIQALYFRVTFVLKLMIYSITLCKMNKQRFLCIYICLEICIKPMVWVARFGRARIFSKLEKLHFYNVTMIFFIELLCTICRNLRQLRTLVHYLSKSMGIISKSYDFFKSIFFSLTKVHKNA